MVAPAYAERRSALARQFGLGRASPASTKAAAPASAETVQPAAASAISAPKKQSPKPQAGHAATGPEKSA